MGNSVLIIDDNRTIRQQLRETLAGTDLFETYHEAGDGIEGFKSLLSEKIDIVLCDLEMPGMDGYKFLRMVASREELMDIPVIMLTSHEDQESKIRGLEAGASNLRHQQRRYCLVSGVDQRNLAEAADSWRTICAFVDSAWSE